MLSGLEKGVSYKFSHEGESYQNLLLAELYHFTVDAANVSQRVSRDYAIAKIE